jgi:hypothetical protein
VKSHGTGEATFRCDKPSILVEVIDRLEEKIRVFKLQMVTRTVA